VYSNSGGRGDEIPNALLVILYNLQAPVFIYECCNVKYELLLAAAINVIIPGL
jgi:hypothetical protein